MKPNIAKAKKHLQRARELAARGHSSFKGMTLGQAIKKMRETREKLWEEKLAARS